MSSDLVRRQIEQGVAAFLASEDPGRAWLRDGVRRHRFLPLHLGWTEVLGIRPDGRLVRWLHEEDPSRLLDLVEPYWRRLALAQGLRRYPDLDELLPERPEGAADCDPCGGTGVLPGHPHLVCACGGIGWRIAGERHSPSPR